ncbi:STAS domain-containing protein [Couchioplanes caeruleus]|uniref:Anti-anti-sigma factor n=2 Tax=Couchioplanes caeruleus TaxID=56438 RepID=A0A1K0FFY0_9ACTN|nr:STAS domain-containing protein [Couchioplanes caeruleus]OJF11632.1 anti-anti-sigma factor [Couchioplanes caeruleus subsp. caeruleus]ROP31616.1 rsbT antagonist protein RsbS [Couchioplanes caeruleus]
MVRVPILQLGDVLLVSIQIDLEDRSALQLQEHLAQRIVDTSARGVVIDISALDVVDSFLGRTFATMAAVSWVLDTETVVVGMRPSVAITLVEMGLSLKGVRTALNLDRAMNILTVRATGRPRAVPDRGRPSWMPVGAP